MNNNQTPARGNDTRKKYYRFLHRGWAKSSENFSRRKPVTANISSTCAIEVERRPAIPLPKRSQITYLLIVPIRLRSNFSNWCNSRSLLIWRPLTFSTNNMIHYLFCSKKKLHTTYQRLLPPVSKPRRPANAVCPQKFLWFVPLSARVALPPIFRLSFRKIDYSFFARWWRFTHLSLISWTVRLSWPTALTSFVISPISGFFSRSWLHLLT